jgi:predicted phosphodiesterase
MLFLPSPGTRPSTDGDMPRAPAATFTPAIADPDAECPPGHKRFVCISDTHGMHGQIPRLPKGDVLIHAGDFSSTGEVRQIESFEAWLSGLPYEHKIVIAGNHDITFHEQFYEKSWKRFHHHLQDAAHARAALAESEFVTYLEDSETSVYGLRIYGSPWQPEFCDWAFNLPRGRPCADKWAQIPDGIDILITHGPPQGHGDLALGGHRAGCEDLLQRVRKLRPRAPRWCVFGHIHEGYGATADEVTTYINASTCNLKYKPRNPPIVFDVPVAAEAGEVNAVDAPVADALREPMRRLAVSQPAATSEADAQRRLVGST